jgi:TrmH family RNA methyltransferase
MTVITSPHNPKLKALRRLQTRRGRAAAHTFLAEGEDLVEAAALAGRAALEGYRLAGTGLGGEGFLRCRGAGAGRGLHARLGDAGDRRLRAALGSAPPWGRCASICTGSGIPATSARCSARRRPSEPHVSRFGPRCADPHSPKAVRASMGAIFSVALAHVTAITELPGERIALAAGAAEPLAGPQDGEEAPVTLLVGAERDGLPEDVMDAMRAPRTDPDRDRVAQRGDGRHGGAVRDDPPTI